MKVLDNLQLRREVGRVVSQNQPPHPRYLRLYDVDGVDVQVSNGQRRPHHMHVRAAGVLRPRDVNNDLLGLHEAPPDLLD